MDDAFLNESVAGYLQSPNSILMNQLNQHHKAPMNVPPPPYGWAVVRREVGDREDTAPDAVMKAKPMPIPLKQLVDTDLVIYTPAFFHVWWRFTHEFWSLFQILFADVLTQLPSHHFAFTTREPVLRLPNDVPVSPAFKSAWEKTLFGVSGHIFSRFSDFVERVSILDGATTEYVRCKFNKIMVADVQHRSTVEGDKVQVPVWCLDVETSTRQIRGVYHHVDRAIHAVMSEVPKDSIVPATGEALLAGNNPLDEKKAENCE